MLSVHIVKKLTNFTLDVKFEVNNEIVALFGPSGSGKTTILNAIAGLTKLTDGTIKLKDRLFVKHGKSLIPVQKRNVGYVFQSYALFPHMTIWENIKYGMKDEKMTKQLIEQLGIEHILHEYPQKVSGGERQRTAMIRALATKPEILLLDEPFSALDEQTKNISIEQVKTVHRSWKIPIIFVSHNRKEVKTLTDTILYIREGKILEEECKLEVNEHHNG